MTPSLTIDEEARGQGGRPRLHARLEGVGADLFAEIAAGSMDAVADLYQLAAADLYGLALFRTGRKEDASDVVQDVFAKLASMGGRLRDVRSPAAWLLSVTRRAAVDVVRRRSRRREEPADDVLLAAADAADPARRMDARRASMLLLRLPARQREAIYLRHVSGLSFREIGAVLRIPTFTAASRYRLGLARLRRLMGESR